MPHQFTDNEGRQWIVALDIATAKRVRTLCGVNLLDMEGKVFSDLAADPIMLVDVLYAALKPEADKLKLTDEQFGAGMAGDAIEHATTALIGAIIDFFPARRRQILHALRNKAQTLTAATDALAETLVDGLNMAILLNAGMAGNGSTKPQASSESTPAPSLSAN